MSAPSPAACALALASLPGIGPVSLSRLLADTDPTTAWRAVLDGWSERPAPASARAGSASVQSRETWRHFAHRFDPTDHLRAARGAGIGVTWLGQDTYPATLVADPLPPPVLFYLGDLDTLARPSVAVVGTRRATPAGRRCALDLGQDLARAGVCVVSGLAKGIDGAAHTGALRSARHGVTCGVAAGGVDYIYPPQHRQLWSEIRARGLILSESPPSTAPLRWRFPSRNRVIAGLSQMVVVVESHQSGGSLQTAEAAIERGIEVRAVPGPIQSSASVGTNALLFDGPGVVRDARDVLEALGLDTASRHAGDPRGAGTHGDASAHGDAGTAGALLSPLEQRIAAALEMPQPLSGVAKVGRCTLLEAIKALDRLVEMDLVCVADGWWQRRRAVGASDKDRQPGERDGLRAE